MLENGIGLLVALPNGLHTSSLSAPFWGLNIRTSIKIHYMVHLLGERSVQECMTGINLIKADDREHPRGNTAVPWPNWLAWGPVMVMHVIQSL